MCSHLYSSRITARLNPIIVSRAVVVRCREEEMQSISEHVKPFQVIQQVSWLELESKRFFSYENEGYVNNLT